jgi:CRISPR-associated exonuclease Cas4
MLGLQIPAGALFYGAIRRRRQVAFDSALRSRTESAAQRLRELIARGQTPPAHYEKKCQSCSLLHFCMPDVAGARRSAESYLRRSLRRNLADEAEMELAE